MGAQIAQVLADTDTAKHDLGKYQESIVKKKKVINEREEEIEQLLQQRTAMLKDLPVNDDGTQWHLGDADIELLSLDKEVLVG